MAVSANADQAEYWNSLPGQNWVAFQADLDMILSGVTDLLLAAGNPREGECLLDIGCGAGASTFALAEAVAPTGRVDGIDISVPLLERARERQKTLEIANVTFTVADAQDHLPSQRAYDMVVSRFGLMFFSDPEAAFRNIGTAIRSGGRIAFAAWAGPEHNPWFSLPQQAAVARLGPVAHTPPDAPGPMAFRDSERVLGIMAKAGFADCQCAEEDIDLHHPGGLEAVTRLMSHVGPIARMLREKDGTSQDRDAIIDTVGRDFQDFRAADGIRIPARVNVFSARIA